MARASASRDRVQPNGPSWTVRSRLGAAGRRGSTATFGSMERPARFEHYRYVGDKRTQLVYDIDEWDDAAVVDEFVAARGRHRVRPRHARRGAQPWLHAGPAGPPADPPHAPRLRPSAVTVAMKGTFTSGPQHAGLPPHGAGRAGRAPAGRDPLPRLPDRTARRPPLGRHLPPARRPRRPRPRLRGDDVQLPRHRHEHRRLLAAGVGRRPAHGDRLPRGARPSRREVVLVGHEHRWLDRRVRRRRRAARAGRRPAVSRGPTSTTGPTTPAGSSSTPARSGRCGRRASRRRSRSGAGRSGASARSTRPVASRRGRCW